MTDEELIALYFDRNEEAIRQTDRQYGAGCRALSCRIVNSREDAEECVNDSYFTLWQQIPPKRPQLFAAFLHKIVRNVSLDKLRRDGAWKRGGRVVRVALDELIQVAGYEDVESSATASELGAAVDRFLRTLPQRQCNVFLRRYFYFEDRSEIAHRYDNSPQTVSVELSRARKKLRTYLTQEGYL